MELVFCGSQTQKEVILKKQVAGSATIIWVEDISGFDDHTGADAFFDLLFEDANIEDRSKILQALQPKPVFINAVLTTLSSIGNQYGFIRINAWPTFLERSITEVSCYEASKPAAETILKTLGWDYRLLPDLAGFYSARIIASIINEAYHTLGDEVSSKEEIDTAMKLGTNYPFGPFEWAGLIGINKVYSLLQLLSKTNSRYLPAPALSKESGKS